MKKRILASLLILLIICVLTTYTNTPVISTVQSAEKDNRANSTGSLSSKEEVIYSTLTASGIVDQIYAVNILNVSSAGDVTDYGSYSSVKNLTSVEELKQKEASITVNAPTGRFYYQGNTTDKILPWDIKITYLLNDSPIDADSLAGKSGHLKIKLTTGQNNAVNPVFFNNYLLQITFTLDTGKCTNITADGATLANAGTDKLITFTVMPSKEGDISLSTDVSDFSMKGIELSAIPFSMNIELPDTTEITGNLLLLSTAINQLSDGISSLTEGVSHLNEGMDDLGDGSSDFQTGLNNVNSNSEELSTASEEIYGALESLNQIAGQLSDASKGSDYAAAISQLSAGITALAGNYQQFNIGLAAYTDGVSKLASSYSMLDSGITDISSGIGDLTIGMDDLEKGATELDSQTEDLPAQLQASVDDILSDYDTSDFIPVSFTSGKNENVTSVQFVFHTAEIEKEELPENKSSQLEHETFWTRLLDLFR